VFTSDSWRKGWLTSSRRTVFRGVEHNLLSEKKAVNVNVKCQIPINNIWIKLLIRNHSLERNIVVAMASAVEGLQ